jgi:hypothetical protein
VPASSHAGSYAITVAGAVDPDYTISYQAGTLTIAPAALTITATGPASVVLGAAVPPVTPTYSGFVNGDSVANLTTQATCTTSYTPGAPVGPYPMTCSGAVDPDYTFTYQGATLFVIYGWSGFLQPINDTAHFVGETTSVFKAGSTVPVKFQLLNSAGVPVQEPNADLPVFVGPVKGSVLPSNATVDESTYLDPGAPGGTFRWDSTGQQYIFNWQTSKSQTGYYYRVGVKLDDGSTYYVSIGLR